MPRSSNRNHPTELLVGNRYKYSDLCALLNEAPCTGNAKLSQLARWRLKFDLVKDSGSPSYLLRDIYSIPLDPQEMRGRKSEYVEAISQILLLLCYDGSPREAPCNSDDPFNLNSNPDFYQFTASRSELYVLLGLCQQSFLQQAYQKHPSLSLELQQHPNLLSQFTNEVFGKCRSILEGARSSLSSKALMNSYESIEFAIESSPNDPWSWRIASRAEEGMLLESKRLALLDLDCRSEPDVYRKQLESKFRTLVLRYLHDIFNLSDVVSYRRSVTFFAYRQVVDSFVSSLVDGHMDDAMLWRSHILELAQLRNNDALKAWLDDRTSKDWYALNNGYRTAFKTAHHRKVSDSEWNMWDDILVELYEGDRQAAWSHNTLADFSDDTNPYAHGPKEREFWNLRSLMRSSYIDLPRSSPGSSNLPSNPPSNTPDNPASESDGPDAPVDA